MVTLEPARDYYADLELSSDATVNDVKRQFRKLALKYHPDRNPGQEAECNSKFQIISAANEILTDPALRAKYDAQRLRDGPSRPPATRPTRPNVPPRNRTTTDYPPPPRPPPPTSYKSTYSPPNSAGSRKYAKPARASAQWGHYDSEEVKAKANDFKAWEQMRHGQGSIPKHRVPPQRVSKNTTIDPDRMSPPKKEPETLSTKAREKWEDLVDAGMSKLGKHPSRPSSRKAGPGHDSYDEDELEARPSAYNVFKGDQPKKPSPPPLPRRETRRGDPVSIPMTEAFPPRTARPRPNYPAPVGNERARAGASGLHRANTSAITRDGKPRPYRANVDAVHLEGDHIRANSAGAANRMRNAGPSGLSSTTTSGTTSDASSDEAEIDFMAGPPRPDRERRIPKSRKPRMPAGTAGRQPSGFSPHVRVDEGQVPNAQYAGSRRHSGIDIPTGSAFGDNAGPSNPNRMSYGANLTTAFPPNVSAEAKPDHRFRQRHRSFDGRYESPNSSISFAPPERGAHVGNDGSKGTSERADSRPPHPPLRSQSSETISTKFSNAGSPPKFGSGNPFAARRPPQQGNESATRPWEYVPNSVASTRHSDNQSPTSDLPPPPKVGDKWSPEEWEKRFGVHTFEVPISNPPSARASSRKRSSTPKSSLNNMRRTGTFRTAAFPSSVIDDDDEPPIGKHKDEGSVVNGARIPRESDYSPGSAMDIDSTPPAAHNREPEEEMSPTSTGPPPKANGTPFGNAEAPGFNLNGFRHVAPFSADQAGLGDTSELKDALPFESKPSAAKPDFEKCYEKVDLPNPPKPPLPPRGLDDMSFAHYISAMNIYMFNWNSFNTKMVLMFQRRQEEHREIGQGWIGQVGGDVGAYLNALEEDERARVWWGTACDKHKVTMQNLKNVRDTILKMKNKA